MSKQERVILREHFETGDRPTQKQFEDLIDSMVIQRDDQIWVENAPTNPRVGIGTETPAEKLHVAGNIRLDGDKLVCEQGSGPFVIMNTANFNGPWMELYGNQNSGRGGEMRFIASDGDMQGFRFLQHKKDGNGQNHWYPRLRITENGRVGIGTETPESELHVKGGLTLEGDLISKQGQDNFWIGNNDGAVIELHGNSKPVSDGREGEMALIAGNGSKGGFRFLQHNGPGSWTPLVAITKDGKMGIGTETPTSKLHIDNTGSANTGLRLPTGAQQGYVLLSDGSGNASWAQPSVLNDGDWNFNGIHLSNGNAGNVGIGISNPQEKLHVQGGVKITGGNINGDNPGGAFYVGNAGGAYLELEGNPAGGRMIFVSGEGTNGGFTFLQKEVDQGQTSWQPRLRIARNGVLVTNNHSINLRTENDANHGLGFYGSASPLTTNKTFAGENVDGPALFGFQGGALGSNQYGSQKIAMRWDQSNKVDFRGNVRTNNAVPFVVERLIITGMEIHFDGQTNFGFNTGKTTDDYAAAMIVGFATSTTYLEGVGLDRSQFDIGVSTYLRNSKNWWIAADIKNATNNEKWAVDVLYIRKEMSVHTGFFWDTPLHAKI